MYSATTSLCLSMVKFVDALYTLLMFGFRWAAAFITLLLLVQQGDLRVESQFQPWEVWNDLHSLAVLHRGDQVLLRSSHCPDGCRYDRHSEGDWRYLRVEGDEGVIFEEAGAGAITRIWMTQGYGTADPLNPSIRIRFYLDGNTTPAIDVPLPELFNGSTSPFLAPLVGNNLVSSGGNFNYVPIAYRDGCKITLLGADEERLWFQFSFHRLASAFGVTSFTGTEDLSVWAALLASNGQDPWKIAQQIEATSTAKSGTVNLGPGETVRLTNVEGSDSITKLQLSLPADQWPEVEVKLTFDNQPALQMSLADFFAVGRGGLNSTSSLFVGVADDGALFNFFPMPFFSNVTVDLQHSGNPGVDSLTIDWQLRLAGIVPDSESGYFVAQMYNDEESGIGVDIPLLNLGGHGRWVGLFADLSSVDTLNRAYLEGDERVFLDSSPHPSIYGTGTEDIFNGGFYFDQEEFQLALHGMPYHFEANGEDTTAAYRFMLNDGATWVHGIHAGLEGGPVSDLSIRSRTIAYAYHRSQPRLWLWDTLDLGDPESRNAHNYSIDSAVEYLELDSFFEGEPPTTLRDVGAYRPAGAAHFRLPRFEGAQHLRLRRRLDAGVAWQAAEIWVDGLHVASFAPLDLNQDRRWREIDIDLPTSVTVGSGDYLEIMIVALPNPGALETEPCFTSFSWQLWADVNPLIFADGFETGDQSNW